MILGVIEGQIRGGYFPDCILDPSVIDPIKEADLANRFLYIYTRQPRDRSVPTFPARGGPPRIYGGAASCASLSETALG